MLAGGLVAGVLAQAPADATSAHSVSREGRGRDDGRSRTIRPVLQARATLDADTVQPGPQSGALATPANGRTGPFPGQVIPGFSAVVDRGDGTFWAQPDNGFGAKTNSADFLLRIYHVRPRWETTAGGSGSIEVLDFVSLADPDHVLDFPIVNDGTPQRLLTGADFDIESLVLAKDGTFWVGDEFGPFLLHFDATGALLQEPVPFPAGKSPANPHLAAGETPNVPSSRGFEAMGGSRNGRYLYPVVEGALNDDADKRRRWIYQYDVRAGRYTPHRWAYQTDQEANLVGDAFMTGRHRMLVVERDDFEGPLAVTKRVYQVNLRRTEADGFVAKTLVLDALGVDNPDLIGAGTGFGTGEHWSLPVQSFETIVRLRDGRLLIANDNNYPGNSARNPGTPDDTEMDLIDLRRVRVHPHDATVTGHRGASGYRPEHTLASYEQAILQCADYIEPDLVSTKDGVLVARHEPEIGGTTDVAQHPEFADRKVTRSLDGVQVTGWFTDDFTLAELRTLRARERLPQVRPANTGFDGRYQVPTFDEVLDLARHSRTCDGQPVGVYPETKHQTYFDQRGLSLEEPLLANLRGDGFDHAGAPVFIQSFETSNLRELDRRTKLPLVQLVDCSGGPFDLRSAGDSTTYADLVTARGLRRVASYADGLGACKDLLIPRKPDGTLGSPTSVIRDAHHAGLLVHAYTFRRENQFLPVDFRSSTDPNAAGDLVGEIRSYLAAGLDGFFTDNPDLGRQAVERPIARTR
jgi:glycerophosphoryl diester phosphodiesterase